MQQIELTRKQQDILKAAWQAYKDDYQEWQQTRKPRGWRNPNEICTSLFDSVELNQLAALGLVENSGFDSQWVITNYGLEVAEAIKNGTVPAIDPTYTDAAQMVAVLQERSAPLLRTANEQLLGQLQELQSIVDGQDAELTALRQQYADQSDELARCQDALKPFADAWKSIPTGLISVLWHWNGNTGKGSGYTDIRVSTEHLRIASETLNGGAK